MVVDSSRGIRLASTVTARLLDEAPLRVTPLVGRGSVNQVFIVETANHKVVVRASERDGAPGEYAKEAWCIERAAARGVPVPAILGAGSFEGSAYLIHTYVEGDEGRESPAPKPDIWRTLGGYAGLIHAIEAPGFGLTLSEITQGDARKSWLRHLEYNIESLSGDDPLIGLGVFTPPRSQALRGVFAGLRGREFTFGLNHGDISLKNTVVDARGRVTLLDWGSAEAAIVPHHELIQLLKMQMLEGDPDGEQFLAFLDGYGISPAGLERLMPELESLLALRAVDKLRWALEWNAGELGAYVSHAREAVSRCLK
jgi:aminoglycoside phosphotransferase (APT) family kinase protein